MVSPEFISASLEQYRATSLADEKGTPPHMTMPEPEEVRRKLEDAQKLIGYQFNEEQYLLSAITHPSAVEGKPVKYSYERLEFLGDSILGAIVSDAAFHTFPELDEGGLTRIKVSLVSGQTLSSVAQELGFADVIIFGLSERGTGRRGLQSALENVYEATVAALYLDGGITAAHAFVASTLLGHMNIEMANEPENPKSMLQEKLQEDGITPTYKLIETQGPPHDRTFVTQVYAGLQALARGVGRTKKESESQAAKSALSQLADTFSKGKDRNSRATEKADAKAGKASAEEVNKAAGESSDSPSPASPNSEG